MFWVAVLFYESVYEVNGKEVKNLWHAKALTCIKDADVRKDCISTTKQHVHLTKLAWPLPCIYLYIDSSHLLDGGEGRTLYSEQQCALAENEAEIDSSTLLS